MESPRDRGWERTAGAALAAAALATLGLLLARAWSRPYLPFDSWSYHLPFAARMHGLSPPGSFLFAPRVEMIYQGFPLLGDWLQGALWRLTGTVRAVALVNALALVGLVGYLAATFRVPLAALAFGFLAFPMVAIHAPSGYVDLFFGVALAAQGGAALRLLDLAEGGTAAGRGRGGVLLHGTLFVVAAGLAGNTKVPGAVMAAALSLFLAAHALRRRFPAGARRRFAALALLALLAASATVVKNAIRYSNPFHPLSLSHLGRPLATDPVPGRSPEASAQAARAGASAAAGKPGRWRDAAGMLRRPAAFLLSATEIDWLLRGVVPLYNIDSNSGDRRRRGEPGRTGGWWGPYFVAVAAGVALEARRRRRAGWTGTERRALALLAVVALTAAATPISFMLRYWIALPLLLVFTLALLVGARPGPRPRFVLSAALAAALLVSLFALPTEASLAPLPYHRYDPATMRARLHPALLAAIEEERRFCLGLDHDPMHFRYSAALVGGRHGVEQVRDRGGCRVYPRLDVPAPAIGRWSRPRVAPAPARRGAVRGPG